MPSSTDAKEYILSHDYHQPLNEWLSDTVKYEMPSHFLNGCHQQMLINKVIYCNRFIQFLIYNVFNDILFGVNFIGL